jgi:23S rRNA (adenine2030-N6)-methyltransferase
LGRPFSLAARLQEAGLNYRHVFHAGNFADLIKHAAVTLIMDRLIARPQSLLVLDSHAGAGTYDLTGDLARKSGEALAGIIPLMADLSAPDAFDSLKVAVSKINGKTGVRVYPGSPALIADLLRPSDAYIGAELRPDDFDALSLCLAASRGQARAVRTDGFDLVRDHANDRRNVFVLIDPPYEKPDDYKRIIDAIRPWLSRPQSVTILIWAPLKDLETFDSFLRRLEALGGPAALVVEARLHPLTDPMRMNGCALVLLGEPDGLEPDLEAAARWVVDSAGGPGGRSKVWRLAG